MKNSRKIFLFRKIPWPLVLSFFFAIGAVETLGRLELIANYLLPLPSQVFLTLFESRSDFFTAFSSTLSSTLFGLCASLLFGLSLAVFFNLSPWLKSAVLPWAVFFQTVPIVSIAPLLVIWFGYGEPTVRASALIVSFFPILANSYSGLQQSPRGLNELFQIYRASRWQKFWKLELPCAIPSILSGLKTSAGLAVIGAIVGEFIAGGGLGSLIDSGRTQQRLDLVFAAIFLSSVLGFLMIACVDLLELAWKKRSTR